MSPSAHDRSAAAIARRQSLPRRWGAGLALAALAGMVCIWSAAGLLIAERRALVIDSSERVLESAAASFGEHAVQTLNTVELTLRHVAGTFDELSAEELAGPDRLRARLRALQRSLPFLRALGLVGPDGRIFASTGARAVSRFAGDRPHVRSILDEPSRRLFVGTPFVTRASGYPAIPVSAPWRDGAGALRGVVTALIDPAYFSQFYAGSLFGRDLSVVLLGPRGIPLGGFPEQGEAASALATVLGPALQETAGDSPALRRLTAGGTAYLVSYSVAAEPQLLVAVAEPMARIERRWWHTARAVVGFALALSLGLLAATGLMWRKLKLGAAMDALQRQSAEERNRLADSKFHFLAQVSHELRTPLNAIIGFSSMMGGEKFGPIGNPRYREYAGDIEESGRHLLAIVNDLLDLAKLDADQFVLREGEFVLADAITAAHTLLKPLAHKGGVRLRVEAGPAPWRLRGDVQLVKQMLINLLGNAIKFTPEHGEVALTVHAAAAGGLTVEVRDTGIGIAAADIPRLLNPYEQAGESPRPERGTGLGLALTRKFAALHGGTLDIVSAVGVGTVVTLGFPPERVASQSAAKAAARPAA